MYPAMKAATMANVRMRDLNMRNAVKRLRGIFDQRDETSHPTSVPARQISQTNRQAGYHALNRRRHSCRLYTSDKQLIRQTNQVHAGEKLKIRVSDGWFYVMDDTPQ